jgi:hypothetical protein
LERRQKWGPGGVIGFCFGLGEAEMLKAARVAATKTQ